MKLGWRQVRVGVAQGVEEDVLRSSMTTAPVDTPGTPACIQGKHVLVTLRFTTLRLNARSALAQTSGPLMCVVRPADVGTSPTSAGAISPLALPL